MFHVIKQFEEKNVPNEIIDMVWCDRMDLVAYSTCKGEVALHRLTWTRACLLGPPVEGLTVKGIAWRPDGKVLAVGYSNGQVLLYSIENKTVLNTIETGQEITKILWCQEKLEQKIKKPVFLNSKEEEQNYYMEHIDYSSIYFREPTAAFNFDPDDINSSDDAKKVNMLHDQSDLNLLLIGTKEGFIHVNIFGCFTCSILNVGELLGASCSVENIHLTEDLSQIYVTIREESNNIKIIVINSSIFKTHKKELFAVALKFVRLNHLLSYLQNAITTMTETWENILLEIDNKLSKYASKVPEGGVSADFLDLLMFGVCSCEMEQFLVVDLTKKGLEKFGQSIDMSYTNIQQLLLKYVTKFGQHVTFHLAELKGMARLESRYSVLGLNETVISDATQANGSFLIKAGEMQQIINQSTYNYKAFFKWLYTAIIHLMEEPIPPELSKMTQQDLTYITEFLQNFDNIGTTSEEGSKKSGFVMERIGQYLADATLTIPPKMDENEWTSFLSENECLRNNPNILNHRTNLSLVQQFKLLEESVERIHVKPKEIIGQQFKMVNVINCGLFNVNSKVAQVNIDENSVLLAFLEPPNTLCISHVTILKQYLKCGKFIFNQHLSSDSDANGRTEEIYDIKDIQFYSPQFLSVLLQDTTNQIGMLYQFSVSHILEALLDTTDLNVLSNQLKTINGSLLGPRIFRNIGMTCELFAVSGQRKVCVVLSQNRRKVKLFEMEAEEEEDEDADMSNNTIKENVSMQDSTCET